MHELIFALVQNHPGAALARFPLDDGALIAAFAGGGGPLWIAKTAFGEAGIRRLRAEATALDRLDPWAELLNLPRRIGWDDGATAPDGAACLVQTSVSGVPATGACDLRRHWAALPEETHRSAAWLRRFQVTVPPPSLLTLADLDRRARRQAECACVSHPQYAALFGAVVAALPPLTEPNRPAVTVHGDFWAGNVLCDRVGRAGVASRAIGVIDWSGLGAGTAIEDLFTWIACLGADRVPSRLERWRLLFFTPGTTRDFLRDWSAGCGYGDSLARWAFYVFLLGRMGWELGLGLQARDAAERAAAQRAWTEIAAWLAQNRYPDPFTPVPV